MNFHFSTNQKSKKSVFEKNEYDGQNPKKV
jgi:hypothetical protein